MLRIFIKCIRPTDKIISLMSFKSPNMKELTMAISRKGKLRKNRQGNTKRRNRRPNMSQSKRSNMVLNNLNLEKKEGYNNDN